MRRAGLALLALSLLGPIGACAARPSLATGYLAVAAGCSRWSAIQQVGPAPTLGLVAFDRCGNSWKRGALLRRGVSSIAAGGGRVAVVDASGLQDHVRLVVGRRLLPVPGLPEGQPSYMPDLDRNGQLAVSTFDGKQFRLLVEDPSSSRSTVRYRTDAELISPQWLPSGDIVILLAPATGGRLAQLAVVDRAGRLHQVGLPQPVQGLTVLTSNRFALLDVSGPVPRTTIVDSTGRPISVLADVQVLARDGAGFLATTSSGILRRYSDEGALLVSYSGQQLPALLQLSPGFVAPVTGSG